MSIVKNRVRIIPDGAKERIIEWWGNGNKKTAYYYFKGNKIGFRYFEENGVLTMEYGLKNNKYHGLYRLWYESGKLLHETKYINGKEHGISKQWDENGNLMGTYKMNHGTGVDLWYCKKGVLSEERHFKNGYLNGPERWWSGKKDSSIYSEQYFSMSKKHGIFRDWGNEGELKRGYPKYFINDKRIKKNIYLKACKDDITLPKYVKDEDRWFRKEILRCLKER